MQNYNFTNPNSSQIYDGLYITHSLESVNLDYTHLGGKSHFIHLKNKSLLLLVVWHPIRPPVIFIINDDDDVLCFSPHSFNPLTRTRKWPRIWETAFIVSLKIVPTTCFLPLPVRKCDSLHPCLPLQRSYRDNVAAVASFQLKNLEPINSKYH